MWNIKEHKEWKSSRYVCYKRTRPAHRESEASKIVGIRTSISIVLGLNILNLWMRRKRHPSTRVWRPWFICICVMKRRRKKRKKKLLKKGKHSTEKCGAVIMSAYNQGSQRQDLRWSRFVLGIYAKRTMMLIDFMICVDLYCYSWLLRGRENESTSTMPLYSSKLA